MKIFGSVILLSLMVACAAFSVSVGWRLGEKAIPRDMPETAIINVSPSISPVAQ